MPFYLDKAQYEKLKSAQTELHDLLPTIDDAEACGIECQALRGVVKSNLDVLTEMEKRLASPPPQ